MTHPLAVVLVVFWARVDGYFAAALLVRCGEGDLELHHIRLSQYEGTLQDQLLHCLAADVLSRSERELQDRGTGQQWDIAQCVVFEPWVALQREAAGEEDAFVLPRQLHRATQ